MDTDQLPTAVLNLSVSASAEIPFRGMCVFRSLKGSSSITVRKTLQKFSHPRLEN